MKRETKRKMRSDMRGEQSEEKRAERREESRRTDVRDDSRKAGFAHTADGDGERQPCVNTVKKRTEKNEEEGERSKKNRKAEANQWRRARGLPRLAFCCWGE
jgi:hypothetical protein